MSKLKNVKLFVFDLGGTLMEYKGMHLSWSGYYKGALENINNFYSLGLSENQIETSVEIFTKYNPRNNPREKEIEPEVIFEDVIKGWNTKLPVSKIIQAFFQSDSFTELLQRQSTMDDNLKVVKGTDFADVATDKVNPGTCVSLRKADGSTLLYNILGEWDSDLSLNIISSRTELAKALLFKTAGDKATIPSPEGEIDVVIEKIEPLNETVRTWMSEDPQTTA